MTPIKSALFHQTLTLVLKKTQQSLNVWSDSINCSACKSNICLRCVWREKLLKANTGNSNLSGNWKTMPTLSGDNISGGSIGLPSLWYLWTEMEPDVGLFSPAISYEVKWKKHYTSAPIKSGHNTGETHLKYTHEQTCKRVVFPLPLRPNIKPKLQEQDSKMIYCILMKHS